MKKQIPTPQAAEDRDLRGRDVRPKLSCLETNRRIQTLNAAKSKTKEAESINRRLVFIDFVSSRFEWARFVAGARYMLPLQKRSLGQAESIAFAYRGRGFGSLIAVNDDQDFVRTDSRITAERAIGHDEADSSVLDPATEEFGDVDRSALHAVVSPDNADAIRVILKLRILAAVIGWAIVPIIAASVPHEHARFDKAAFSEIELALLISPVSGKDTQTLVGADGGIAAHGLVVHCDAAIDTAAADEVFENIGDVVALVSCAVVGANNLPAVILSGRAGAQKGDRGSGE